MMNKNTEPDYDEKSSVDADNLILRILQILASCKTSSVSVVMH